MLHLGWIYVTQFCRKWREVALGHGALWTYIDPYVLGEQWTHEMILRSKGAALTFHQDYMSHRRYRASEFPQAQGGGPLAVRDIEIVNYVYPFGGDAVFRLLQKPQPALERLTFHAAPMQQGRFVSMPLIHSFLGGQSATLPRLLSVSLLNTIPPWNSPVFTASLLTSLYIGFTPAHAGDTREAVESRVHTFAEPLLMTLESLSKSLESLELVNCLPLEWPDSFRSTPGAVPKSAVTLYRLQSLKVTCSTLDVCFHFMDHLTLMNALTVLQIDASSPLPGEPEPAYDRVISLVQELCFPHATSTSPRADSSMQGSHSHPFNELLVKHVIPYGDNNPFIFDFAPPRTLFIHLGVDFFQFQRSVTPSRPICACCHPPDIKLSLPLVTTSSRLVPSICTRLLDTLPINWTTMTTLAVVADYPFRNDVRERPYVAWSVSQADKLIERMSGLRSIVCGSEIASTMLDALLKSHRYPRPLPLNRDRRAYDDFDATLTVRSRIRLPHLQDFYLVDPDFTSRSFTFRDLVDPEDLAAWQLAHPRICIGLAAGGDLPRKLNRVMCERGMLNIPIGTVHVVLSGNQYMDCRVTPASNEKRVMRALNGEGVTRIMTKDMDTWRV